MTVSALDCTGCGSCVNVCPGKKGEKALTMANMEDTQRDQQEYYDYGQKLPAKEEVVAKFKAEPLKEASSNSHCLSSQELVLVVVKHLTLN